MTASVEYPKLRLGTAPDSWGVWNPGLDPLQTPWTRYLDEVQAAGYRYSELGPYGYLPTDPGVIRDEYAKRGLTLTGGTVFVALHKGKDALAQAKADCDAEMATIGPLGARHLVILPEGYTDFQGNLIGSPTLTDDEWTALTTGMSELGRYVADAYGAVLVFHTHADSNVGTQAEIERFLDAHGPRGGPPVPRHGARRVLRRRQPGHSSATTADRIQLRPPQAGRPGDPPARDRRAARVRTGRPPRRRWSSRRSATRTCRPCWRRSGRSTGSCSASSSRTCTRATRTSRCRSPPAPASTSRHAGSTSGGRRGAAASGRASMTIRVGVIGTGAIGTDHAHKLAHAISGSTVAAVTDINRARAEEVAAEVGGATVFDDGFDADRVRRGRRRADHVDRPRRTPRSPSPASPRASPSCARSRWRPPPRSACRSSRPRSRWAGGSSSSGYMRRQDPGYRQVKASLDGGAIGEALILHNVHRNPTVPDSFTSFMTMTDSIIHEIDTSRWLLGEELGVGPGHPAEANGERRRPPPGPPVRGVHDPIRRPRHGRVLRQLPVRLRRPVRARGLGGDGVAREPGRWPRR